MHSTLLSIILIVPIIVMTLLLIRGRRGSSAAGLDILDPQVENGIFTFLTVTERPLEPDAAGKAYCSYRGRIEGPLTEPVEVFRREIRSFDTLWPEVGAQVAVAYLPGKVKETWQFIALPEKF